MFPIAPQIVVLVVIATLVLGVAIGLLSGSIFAWMFGLHVKGIWKDGALGALGACVGFLAALAIPWPENTVTTQLAHGAVIEALIVFSVILIVAAVVLTIARR